jgi:hypothetical protein
MRGACSTHCGHKKYIESFGWKNLKGRDHLEYFEADMTIIFKWSLKVG